MKKKEVLKRAEAFCNQHNITAYPVRIVELCEKYDFSVLGLNLTPDVSGIIIAQDENIDKFNTNKLIAVNLADSAKRRRFTIAHELAHYILHRNNENEVFAHRDAGQTSSLEVEANTFASAILMPEQLVYDSLSYLGDNWKKMPDSILCKHIADDFVVSTQAARVRLEQLGVIDG